jgi:hypothetical protein
MPAAVVQSKANPASPCGIHEIPAEEEAPAHTCGTILSLLPLLPLPQAPLGSLLLPLLPPVSRPLAELNGCVQQVVTVISSAAQARE